MRIRKQNQDVVSSVQDQTSQAESIARVLGQDRLADPRTNPAVRPHADRLRDVQHRMALDAEHSRARRRHRVEDRHASHAEKSLEALQEAREASSAARSVLALHASRIRYMRLSLATSVVLAFGSARGLEHLAGEYKNVPKGSGYIAEIGLTGLATVVILAKSDLAQHGGKVKVWQDASLWALMVTPLTASMVANVYGGNVIGAICAAGAAAFAFFSFIVATVFAVSARSQAEKVTGEDESSLREIAIGNDLFSTRTESQGVARPAVSPSRVLDRATEPRPVPSARQTTKPLAGGAVSPNRATAAPQPGQPTEPTKPSAPAATAPTEPATKPAMTGTADGDQASQATTEPAVSGAVPPELRPGVKAPNFVIAKARDIYEKNPKLTDRKLAVATRDHFKVPYAVIGRSACQTIIADYERAEETG